MSRSNQDFSLLSFNPSKDNYSPKEKHQSPSDKKELLPGKKYPFFFSSQNSNQTIFVIIDMQPSFEAANDQAIILALGEALQNAMREGQYILIVNYLRETSALEKFIEEYPNKATMWERNESGELEIIEHFLKQNPIPIKEQLHSDLKKIIDNYPNKATIWKGCDSGGIDILDHLKSKKISSSRFCVSGVNVCACIMETVWELSKELSKNNDHFLIELNESCCSCDCKYRSVCTNTINRLEDSKGVINTSKLENTPLKTALINLTPIDVQDALSEYEKKIAEYACTKVKNEEHLKDICNKLKDIKRDLLISMYTINYGNRKLPNIDNSLEVMQQSLNTIQIYLDKKLDFLQYLNAQAFSEELKQFAFK